MTIAKLSETQYYKMSSTKQLNVKAVESIFNKETKNHYSKKKRRIII